MHVRVQSQPVAAVRSELLVVPVLQGGQNGPGIKELDVRVDGALREQLRRRRFQGKRGEMV